MKDFFLIRQLLVLCAAVVTTAAAGSTAVRADVVYYPSEGQICGGVVGAKCPSGYTCEYFRTEGTDAQGVCKPITESPRPGPPDLSGPPPVADPTGRPLGVQCPSGTTWLSGQCVAVWPLPGPPPVVTTEKGPPPAVNCPVGMISMSGQCVPISLPGMPPPSSGKPLTVENRTRQVIQIWLYQPGNFTVPYLTFSLNPGSGDLTQPDRSPLMITPEWGIAAMTASQSLSWPVRALGNSGYEVDAAGHYRIVLTEP